MRGNKNRDILASVLVLGASLGTGVACSDSEMAARYADRGDEHGCGGGACEGPETPNTNVNFGGAQDIGFFRKKIQEGVVPESSDIDAAGFFAEHHTPLPEPTCGKRLCLQAMLGVMGNLVNGENCTLLQVGMNSTVAIDAENRPPLSVAVVVDVSGSMDEELKIDFVREGLHKLVRSLRDNDRIALITYSTDARLLFEMQDVQFARNDLADLIDDLQAEGATNLHAGLELGYVEVLANLESERQHRVMLLSDGQPTIGITSTDAILGMSQSYNSEGVGLTTIGLGQSFNLDLMKSLSEQGDGNFYFVEDVAAIDEVFTEEIEYFTVPVAKDIRLEAKAGDAYRFRTAYGTSKFAADDDRGGVLEMDSVFLAHRKSSEDVTKEGGRRGGGSALLLEWLPRANVSEDVTHALVAEVSLEFTDPATEERVTEEIAIEYAGSPAITPESGWFDNEIVTKSFVMLNILVGLQSACDTFHAGAPEEAMQLLAALNAAVIDYNEELNEGEGDTDMKLDIELIEGLIGVMEENSFEPEPAEISSDPWPAD